MTFTIALATTLVVGTILSEAVFAIGRNGGNGDNGVASTKMTSDSAAGSLGDGDGSGGSIANTMVGFGASASFASRGFGILVALRLRLITRR